MQLKELPIIYSDVFISLGNMCRPAYWLQYAKLRKCALPLDWMREYTLDAVLDMIKNKNISYFEDFTETVVENSPTRHVTCNASKIECIHHFPIKYSVKEYLPKFTTMFNKRRQRFLNILKTHKNVCFITNRIDPVESIVRFLKEVTKLYPKTKFIMINVRKKDHCNYVNKYTINSNCIFYDYNINDIDEHDYDHWRGNLNIWKSIIKKLRLNHSSLNSIKKKKNKYF